MPFTPQFPEKDESAAYFHTYIGYVKNSNFLEVLQTNSAETTKILQGLSPQQWDFRYAPEKWSVKEVIIHIMDVERIFAYRALRIARHDTTPLLGFEHNDYVAHYDAAHRSPESIIEEYQLVRASTLALFKNLPDSTFSNMGTASGFPVSVRALGFMTAGHELHHFKILKERYFSAV